MLFVFGSEKEIFYLVYPIIIPTPAFPVKTAENCLLCIY